MDDSYPPQLIIFIVFILLSLKSGCTWHISCYCCYFMLPFHVTESFTEKILLFFALSKQDSQPETVFKCPEKYTWTRTWSINVVLHLSLEWMCICGGLAALPFSSSLLLDALWGCHAIPHVGCRFQQALKEVVVLPFTGMGYVHKKWPNNYCNTVYREILVIPWIKIWQN